MEIGSDPSGLPKSNSEGHGAPGKAGDWSPAEHVQGAAEVLLLVDLNVLRSDIDIGDTPKRPEVLSFSQGTCSTMVIYSWDPSLIEAVNPLVSLIESGQGPILSDINTSGSELDALKTG